jgi:hypothetical protein
VEGVTDTVLVAGDTSATPVDGPAGRNRLVVAGYRGRPTRQVFALAVELRDVTINQSLFLKLMLGAFGTAILAFMVRGISTVAVGSETAQVVAAPVFVLAVALVTLAFVLSVLVKLGVIKTSESDAETAG